MEDVGEQRKEEVFCLLGTEFTLSTDLVENDSRLFILIYTYVLGYS